MTDWARVLFGVVLWGGLDAYLAYKLAKSRKRVWELEDSQSRSEVLHRNAEADMVFALDERDALRDHCKALTALVRQLTVSDETEG